MHPQFNQRLASNDIGLITVEKKIRFTPFLQPIPLETKPILDRQQGVVAGWGISSRNRRTIILQYLMVRIFETQTAMIVKEQLIYIEFAFPFACTCITISRYYQ